MFYVNKLVNNKAKKEIRDANFTIPCMTSPTSHYWETKKKREKSAFGLSLKCCLQAEEI